MVLEHLIKKPVCVDIINKKDNEQYFPIDKKGNLLQTKFISFLIKRGYLYDKGSKKWYILHRDGLYYETDDETIGDEVIYLARHNTPPELNITTNFISSTIRQLGGLSNTDTLSEQFNTFLEETDLNYYIPESIDKPGSYDGELIPVNNGILNTSNMELLPHCGYFFAPCPYNVDYYLIPDDELRSSPCYGDYLTIIPDEYTLHFFFWWAGMVLFSQKPEQMILFLYGSGGTGKSSIADALSIILGGSRVSRADLRMIDNIHGSAVLEGKRLNITAEVDKKSYATLNTFIKQVSGESKITINQKFKDAKTIENTVNLLFIGNSFMACDLSDPGIRRRLFVIECPNKMNYESGLMDKLKDAEHLNWFFNMALFMYTHNKGKDPHEMMSLSMRDTLNEMFSSDSFNSWIISQCGDLDYDIVRNRLAGEIYSELYDDYSRYTHAEYDVTPITKKDFREKLRIEYRLKYSSRGDKNVMVRI